jgi:hypothetical protein
MLKKRFEKKMRFVVAIMDVGCEVLFSPSNLDEGREMILVCPRRPFRFSLAQDRHE